MTVIIDPASPTLCPGNGEFVTLTANVAGGLSPYNYSWNSGQLTQSINATAIGLIRFL